MSAARNVTPQKFNDVTGAIRALAMDAVQKANSGHPGAPMGMAEIAEVLWNHHFYFCTRRDMRMGCYRWF